MKIVVDASVAIKWVVVENGRVEALDLLAGEELVAPDFVLVEAANILWRKARMGEVDKTQTVEGLTFIRRAWSRLVPGSSLVERAAILARELDHPVYDCLYLACAEAESAPLATADTRLAARANTLRDVDVMPVGFSP